MGKGYAEGPAVEERTTDQPVRPPRHARSAVFGSTDDDPGRHFIGWADEVDPDELFARGMAWGLSIAEHVEDEGAAPGGC